MKRFFQPVEKDGSLKKKKEESAAAEEDEVEKEKKGEPTKFLTWNANSLLLRVKNDWSEFTKLIQTLDPDVIAVQVPFTSLRLHSVKVDRLDPVARLFPRLRVPSERVNLQITLPSLITNHPLFSFSPRRFLPFSFSLIILSPRRRLPFSFNAATLNLEDVCSLLEVRMPAAGAKGASKNPSELKGDTSTARDEKQVLMRALSSPPFGSYRVWWSLSDSKYGGTALFIKKQFKPQNVSFCLERTASKHEPDGRVILAEFESYFLLNTYVPNNGWKEEEKSFKRRRKWDKRILDFVLQIKKPLIWCGDLNVSHQDIDVSHPDFFSTAKLNGYTPPSKEDCGQPGFTLAERRRFSNILSQGKLTDVYRYLHKEQDMECGFSWSGNPVGKYRGKRMRIDYFVVSEQLKDMIVECKMHGQGIELKGFYGSDHCPVSLELSQKT